MVARVRTLPVSLLESDTGPFPNLSILYPFEAMNTRIKPKGYVQSPTSLLSFATRNRNHRVLSTWQRTTNQSMNKLIG
jgi:hypothetical protein